MPTSVPLSPNLEQLRKQAKDLRRAHGEGSSEAALRLRAWVSRFAAFEEQAILASDLALRDAQHCVAREHGFASWQDARAAAGAVPAAPRQLVSDAADYHDDDLLPVQLLQTEIVERAGGGRVAAAVLRAEDDRIVVISIGEPEGAALRFWLHGGSPRPLTHDLLAACLEAVGGQVTAVVVHRLQESTFLAHVVLVVNGVARYVDARPSDCLNLAARRRAPVFVTRAVLDVAGRPLSNLQGFLQRLATDLG